MLFTKEIVFQQELLEKAYIIVKMTGLANFWRAPLVTWLHWRLCDMKQ